MRKAVFLVFTMLLLFGVTAGSAWAAPQKGKGERTVETRTKQVGVQSLSYVVSTPAGKHKPQQTVLVLHGAASNAHSTDTLAAALGTVYPDAQIVQLDLPAHGNSVGQALTSIFDIAAVVEQFLRAGLESGEFAKQVLPVGVSMGGSVAQLLALSDLKAIKQVALVSTSPDWTHLTPMADIPADAWTATYSSMIQADFAVNTTPEQQAAFAQVFPSYSASVATSLADTQALIHFSIFDRIAAIKQKVLIIGGDADQVALIGNEQKLAAAIKHSKLLVIPGETHTYSMKQPTAVAQAIHDYFH